MKTTPGYIAVLLFIVLGFGRVFSAPVFPLKISEDRRCLTDQKNIPFFINGDSPWSLLVRLSKSQAQQYLEDRRQKGFNAVIVNLIEHKFSNPAPKNIYGVEPFLAPGDYSTPNEAYFLHADSVIKMAAERGILVVLAPSCLGYQCRDEGWCEEMKANGGEKLRAYGRYVGNRYKNQTNILWLEAGDADAAEHGVMDLVDAVAYGIKDADTVKPKLHTAHCTRGTSALDCYDHPWLDLNSTYSDCERALSQCRKDYERWMERKMPFIFLEGDYENEKADAVCVRSQAYGSILSGAAGHFTGNCPIWHFGSNPTWCNSANWQINLNSAGSRNMGPVAALFNSREWTKLVPDLERSVVVSGDSGMAVARTSDSNTVVAYMPSDRKVTVNMEKMAGTDIKAWWFNPVTGTADLIGTFPNAKTQTFVPTDKGDWVLVLDNAAVPFPAPGKKPYSPGKKK